MHLLHLDQPLLEINITPDRGYAFSYRGVAREYHHSTGAVYTDPATALGKKAPVTQGLPEGVKSDIEVIVDDKNPIHGVVAAIVTTRAPCVVSTRQATRRTGCAAA